MASPLRSVILGEDYQTRTFWIEASRLFFERGLVRRVSIEHRAVRGFDDVVTAYEKARLDPHGRDITLEGFQNKYHVAYDREIRAEDLALPDFIGAETNSLLTHVATASGGKATPVRLTLVTPWRVNNSDPLRLLVDTDTGALLLHRLFASGGGREMRQVRDRWRAALGGMDDEAMARALQHLRIKDAHDRSRLDELLGLHLERAWLAPVDPAVMNHPYEGLARRFMAGAEQIRDHDHDALKAILEREGLWRGRPPMTDPDPEPLAIKSFDRWPYPLEDEARVLDLLPFFHGREKLDEVDWDADLYPRVAEFFQANVAAGGTHALIFDTHLSIAFAAGYALDKADATIVPVQNVRDVGRVRWPSGDGPTPARLWEDVEWTDVGNGGPEIAVALEVTNATFADAATYIKEQLPRVGRIARLTIADGPHRESVKGGAHAHALAARAGVILRDLHDAADPAELAHLFASAPAGLMFLMGRQAAPWGRFRLYEFPGPAGAAGAYSPSFTLPPR